MSATPHPCLTCGACCACYRVDFDVLDRDDSPGGFVPAALSDPLTATLCRMRGTDLSAPRCIALAGTVGEAVRCTIYASRPNACREFEAGDEACDRARRRHGLAALPAP